MVLCTTNVPLSHVKRKLILTKHSNDWKTVSSFRSFNFYGNWLVPTTNFFKKSITDCTSCRSNTHSSIKIFWRFYITVSIPLSKTYSVKTSSIFEITFRRSLSCRFLPFFRNHLVSLGNSNGTSISLKIFQFVGCTLIKTFIPTIVIWKTILCMKRNQWRFWKHVQCLPNSSVPFQIFFMSEVSL